MGHRERDNPRSLSPCILKNDINPLPTCYYHMKTSLNVGKIIGIPINIHFTFLLILPLFAWVFAISDVVVFGIPLGFAHMDLGFWVRMALGVVGAVIFFLSVLAHELAHSYVAIKNGYSISGINLFIFGGVSQIEEVPSEAPGEALISFVGPVTSFAIGAIMLPIMFLLDSMGTQLSIQAVSTTFGLIGFYNILLGGFNLIPAFPMDGGRILRSLLAKKVGFMEATRIAVSVGKAMAIAMGIIGLFVNIWLILIAVFIYMGASEEERGAQLSYALEGVKVRELMTEEVKTVERGMPLNSFMDKMLKEKHTGYPVVDGGSVVGVVTLQDVTEIPRDRQGTMTVGDVMSGSVVSVSPDSDALDASKILSKRDIGRLLVMEDDRLVGIVTRTDVVRSLEIFSARAKMGRS